MSTGTEVIGLQTQKLFRPDLHPRSGFTPSYGTSYQFSSKIGFHFTTINLSKLLLTEWFVTCTQELLIVTFLSLTWVDLMILSSCLAASGTRKMQLQHDMKYRKHFKKLEKKLGQQPKNVTLVELIKDPLLTSQILVESICSEVCTMYVIELTV